MPRSDVSERLLAIKASIVALGDVFGDGVCDLSEPGAVTIGRGLMVDGPDCAVVLGAWSIDSDPTKGETDTVPYTHRIGIAARRTASSDDEETRLLDALDLADALTIAILTDGTIGGRCAHNMGVTWAEYQDAAPDSAGPVIIVGEITYTILRPVGSDGEGL